jgi:hypothetical protein
MLLQGTKIVLVHRVTGVFRNPVVILYQTDRNKPDSQPNRKSESSPAIHLAREKTPGQGRPYGGSILVVFVERAMQRTRGCQSKLEGIHVVDSQHRLTRIPFQDAHGGTYWVSVDEGDNHQISATYPSSVAYLLMLALFHDRGDQTELSGHIWEFDQRSLFGESPNHWTHGMPLRSRLLTTLMWPSRMPLLRLSVPTRDRPQRKIRTQPFSITKLKARTVSSNGTERVSVTNTVMVDV